MNSIHRNDLPRRLDLADIALKDNVPPERIPEEPANYRVHCFYLRYLSR